MFWRKKNKNKVEGKVELKPLNYPTKVVAAWAEAISGNKEILEVLLKSEFKELGLFVYALHNKDDARMWLMKNGYPHLMAMINGVEGKKDALHWLKQNKMETLYHMAKAGDGDEDAFNWLLEVDKDMAMIAKKIEFVKDEIEADNNDVHRISKQ
ncbi:MAG: hypothetical protein ACWA41_05940 [Putridiphycobacter sp.]